MTRMPIVLLAALLVLLVCAGSALADPDPPACADGPCPPAVGKVGEIRAYASSARTRARAAARIRARASAASGTTLETCDDFHPPEAQCGSVDVPLDRTHPEAGTIPIFFTIIPHGAPGPARGTILASNGGPGFSATADGGFQFLFGGLLDRRDLLLIDLRGTGRSAAIDCEAAQHGIGAELDAVRACGAQLGAAASRYGSADRAEDIEAVRAALGIRKFDYYGLSAGGLTVQAYAARHGDHLRTAILDSPYRTGDDAFQTAAVAPLLRAARLICERSPSCSAADPRPLRTLRELIERLRARPVSGTAFDADGRPHTLVVDETRLINMLGDDSGGFLTHSELSAAARALARGDSLPLLRIAAETDFPVFADSGDLRSYSAGDHYATFCADGEFPWDETAPAEATRRAQYAQAVAALPGNAFAPFSVAAWERSFVATADTCVPWPQREDVAPPVPPGAAFPDVQTLVLAGELDAAVPSENARAVAAQFPDAQFVEVANTGHDTVFNSDCAYELVNEFVDTGGPVDAGCAAAFNPKYAVRSFPRRAAFAPAPPVDPAGDDRSWPLDRRVAGMAWAAAYDGIQRSFRMFGTDGVGLRGGTFSLAFTDSGFALAYDRVRFAKDVAVSGDSEVDWAAGGQVVADLAIDGPGPRDGTLHVEGKLFPHTGPVPARGTIGGRRVAVLLPTA